MFQGSLPPKTLAIVQGTVTSWPAEVEAWVACSGNFTIERALASAEPDRRVHSNDVSFYSVAIGRFLAGDPPEYQFTPEATATFPWLAGSLGVSAAQDLAVIQLCSNVAQAFGPDREDHPWWSRQARGYQHQWADLVAKTTAKIEQLGPGVKLASFDAEDVYTWVDRIPEGGGVASFPPFWVGGYTTMFSRLAAMFDSDPVEFVELDEDRLAEVIDKLSDREFWTLALPIESTLLRQRGELRGQTRTSSKGKDVFVYASVGPRRRASYHQKNRSVLVPRLPADQTLRADAEVGLLELDGRQLNQLRSLYLSPSISMATMSVGVVYGVIVDGFLVGCFALTFASTPASHAGRVAEPTVYLLSDFPVAPSVHLRLSKLIVMAAMSVEARDLLDQRANRRFRSLVTTAFSQRPVSMKYRGLLDLLDRKDRSDGRPGFALNYAGPLARWTLREAYDDWYSKHSQTAKDS